MKTKKSFLSRYYSTLLLLALVLLLLTLLTTRGQTNRAYLTNAYVTNIPPVLRFHPARVVRVVDGDTAQVDIELGCGVALKDQYVRFLNCNAPERFTPTGPAATAIVRAWLPTNQAIVLEMPVERDATEQKEKYGRWLGTVFVGGTNLSATLVSRHPNIFKP